MKSPKNTSQPNSLQFRLAPELTEIRRVALHLRTFLEAHDIEERDIWACELAFVEGCNNAVQHSPIPKAAITVEVLVRQNEVEVVIRDNSDGFTWPERIELPEAERENGRGLYLIEHLMDKVSYLRKESNNCLTLKKTLTGI